MPQRVLTAHCHAWYADRIMKGERFTLTLPPRASAHLKATAEQMGLPVSTFATALMVKALMNAPALMQLPRPQQPPQGSK
jgi:hypothetical protein